MNISDEKFAFLKSTRFWAVILGAISMYLESKGLIGEPERNLIATIVVGFTTIKTIDRNTGDSKVIAAEVQAEGQVDAAKKK